MRLERYNVKYKDKWDYFVNNSKNGHFFFQRDYMEYHSDRFDDISLLVFNDKEELMSILPASLKNETMYSHQGLTFGGFVVNNEMKAETMLVLFKALKLFCFKNNINKIIYKCTPYIYHLRPSEEDLYALFINNFKLIRRDVTTTINLADKIKYQERRRRAVKKSLNNGLVFEQTSDFIAYWNILEDVLKEQHDAKPVHSAEEIMKLANIFPDNIKLFVAKKEKRILGGTLIFENKQIVHTQYLVNSIEGRDLGALDFVIDRLLNEIYKDKKYFDFGISNEEAGRYLNTGLIAQKEGFGARAVVHDFYELNIHEQ
jgi:hypothetical protein